MKLVLHRGAQRDIANAFRWYEARLPGLGKGFVDEVEAAFQGIREMPFSFFGVYRGVKRSVLRRFPYVIYFRVVEDQIEILAAVHGRRNPRVWKRRVKQP